MTAYEKKESSATNNRMDTADTSKGKRNDTATPQDTASTDKVTESSEEWQEQEEKFSPTPSGNTGSEEDEHEQFALTRRDEAVSLVNKMEDDAEIAPEIELTISNWDTLFGEEGIVKTPLGEVKMGENQSAKLMRQGRESKLGMIKPTLENPDVIIEASSEAKEGSITERGSSYIFVKAFRKSDGLRYYYFTSVTVSKEGKEVVVSSQEKSRNRLLRLLTDEEIIWRTPKDATTSSAERQGLDYVQPLDAETATKGSGLTPQRISSADKVTESSEEWQEQEEKFSPTPSGNIGSEEETYTLSSETSENGESFYQNNDGNIDLADIPDEVFDKIGKPKALFRLTPSMLKHVFDRHGKEMGLHHADDAIDFVLDVLNNFDHVRQGDKGAIIFSIENGRSRTGRRAVTILLDSQRGEYYGIKTSGYERIEGLHKRPLLWEKGAKETSATGVAPANVTTNEALQGNEPTGSASNHGNDPMGKVTESSEELQEKEDKFTPAPIEDGEDYVDYAARVTAAKAQHDAIKAVENATDTESQRLATDAALEGLKRADVPVEVVSDEQAAVMLGEQKGVELSAKQKRALETASPAMQDHHTVVSSADGTKVLKGLDNTIEEDLKITDHVQFMKAPSGTLYGWTVGGKIYLTKDGLNPNTPIHEYTHLWARAMKERNKEGWQSVKELLRDTPVWDEVLKDKNYQDILDDEDAVASEALSRISGKKNAEKMEAEARKMIDEAKDYVDKAKAISLLERMRSALKKFWNWVGKDLFGIKKFSSVDEITDRVLYDLTNGTDLKGAASEKVEKQQVSTGSEEERAIIEHAKESGTYMKAPNGKPTRLTEKQWAQVRTKAFKSWFGDWEKAARIEKLRKSEPVEITGEEIAPSDELKQYKRNALEYGKTLRGEYTNEDTKETIALTGGNSRGGIREILQHDYKDIEHLQSIAAIPQIIEKSTYIDEAPNEDVEKYPGIKSFRYYVCGLKIGNNDYTVKAVIAVQNNGDRYYDHKLSSIEKGKLLSIIPTIQEAGIEDNLPLSIGKDRRLLSILQTNSSKVVDENGEPLVVHHSTDNEFDTFSKEKLGENTDQNASDDSVAATAHIGFWFNTNDLTGTLFQERDVAGYLDVKEPYEFNSLESLVEDMSYYSSAEEFVDRLKEDGYDGIVVRKDEEMGGTSYVAFEPNQIKSATDNNGEFSQESDDIRYRESKGSSERTLVGIHNISADKLSKAIKQDGLANPSVAVIDISKQQHTGYGEISLIMPSDKINKRTGKNAGTFEGDAWTPMYPSVERQMSREGSLVMEHDIKALPNEMQLGVRNALRNWLDNRVDTKLSYLYLFQQGKAPDFETIKPKYNKEVHGAFGDIIGS